jgi:type II secretory pathway component PulF
MLKHIKGLGFASRAMRFKSLPTNHFAKGFKARIIAAGDRLAFSWQVREGLYKHLSAQVSNHVTVEAALDKFVIRLARKKKSSSSKIIRDVARRMRDGQSLAQALSDWVPSDEVSIIASGERGGKLSGSLDLVVESKRRVARVNAAIKSALVMPATYAAMVFGMIWAIGRFVTPSLEQALPKDRAEGMVYALYVAGDFANSWWPLLPLTIVAFLVYIVIRSFPRWTGKSRIAAEKYFPYSFYRDMQGYTWLMGFTSLLLSGMPDVEILKREKAKASPWLKERLNAYWFRVSNGKSLSDALLAEGANGMPAFGFPNPDIVEDIESMSGFHDFSERITNIAMHWAVELESSTLAGAARFGFWMEMVMYAVMGFLMVAVNSMGNQLGSVPM